MTLPFQIARTMVPSAHGPRSGRSYRHNPGAAAFLPAPEGVSRRRVRSTPLLRRRDAGNAPVEAEDEPERAARCWRRTHQVESLEVGGSLEQAPTLGVDHRCDSELELVDEALCEQRLGELDAAVDADVLAGQGLQVADDVGDRTGDGFGIGPRTRRSVGQRAGGDDVLLDAVDEVREGLLVRGRP